MTIANTNNIILKRASKYMLLQLFPAEGRITHRITENGKPMFNYHMLTRKQALKRWKAFMLTMGLVDDIYHL